MSKDDIDKAFDEYSRNVNKARGILGMRLMDLSDVGDVARKSTKDARECMAQGFPCEWDHRDSHAAHHLASRWKRAMTTARQQKIWKQETKR